MQPNIVKEDIIYGDSPKLHGLIAYDPTKKEKVPGVIVVHEGFGQGDYSKNRAVQLAELGYVGFAADMYGEGKNCCTIEEVMTCVADCIKSFDTYVERFKLAVETIKKNEHCDPNNIAAIGYCYGGFIVLNVIKVGVELKGVASFHGQLKPIVKAEKGKVKAKALVCNGEADPAFPKELIEAFKKEFDDAEIDYKFINYPDAKHSFTNPEADEVAERLKMTEVAGYNEKADRESWLELQNFLKDIFKN